MAVASIQFYSRSLNRQVHYSALIPEDHPSPYSVLLQLHGSMGSQNDWLLYSNLARHVSPYPFLVILPAGENALYANIHPDLPYESFLMQDLWTHVRHTFRVDGKWAVGGVSMGAYGAMRLAFKYPNRFASVWTHSGAYPYLDELRLYPETPNPSDFDLFALTEGIVGLHDSPAIGFDCGTEDHLLGHSRRLRDHLLHLGLAHEYAEHPGGHTWDYWDVHIREALRHHSRSLGYVKA